MQSQNKRLHAVTTLRQVIQELRGNPVPAQDADVVLFIYRKDKDKINPTVEDENMAEIIIAKHRNGPTGMVKLKFDEKKVCFVSVDKYHSPVNN